MTRATLSDKPPQATEPRVAPGVTELVVEFRGAELRVPVVRRSARDLGDKKAWKRRYANHADLDFARAKTPTPGEGCALVDADTDRLIAVYLEPGPLTWADVPGLLRKHKPTSKVHRQSGMAGLTKVFGFMPRKKGRQDWCRATNFSARNPMEALRLDDIGVELSGLYAQLAPALHAWHAEQVEALVPDFQPAPGAVYTSGIVNYDYNIPYHFDAGNVHHCWSAMLGFKRDCSGGELVIPAYDVVLPIRDGSVTLFDGQSVLHGVSPFHLGNADGYRITVVFYTLKDMWACLPPEEEIARFRRARLKQERKRRADDRARRAAKAAEEE